MRTLMLPATLLLTAAALAACGGGSAAEADPAVLFGKEFTVTTMAIGGQTLEPVAGSTIVVTTLEDSISANAGCNTLSGEAAYSPTQITVDTLAMTMMACEQALMDQDSMLAVFLEGDPSWKLDGQTLTLSVGSDSITLQGS